MSYDTKCFDLAHDFLEDEPDFNDELHRDRLAQTIQTAIEDAIETFRGEGAMAHNSKHENCLPGWSGSPNPTNPDSEWICERCGEVVEATKN